MKKYKLTNIQNELHVLGGANIMTYQIEALIDIPSIGVKAGDMGGYVVDGHRLSQIGNCWLFPDSVATYKTEISENAVIKGESVLSSGATIRGEAVIENSEIGSNTLIAGNSVIRKSMLYGGCKFLRGVEIIESELRAIHIDSGRISKSTIRAVVGEPLKAKGFVTIKDSTLEIHGVDNFIEKGCRFESVKAEHIHGLQFFENVHVLFSDFIEETYLQFGERGEENDFTNIIKGVNGICTFEEVKLSVKNSYLIGQVFVKGNVTIKNSTILGCSTITNKSSGLLSLSNVQMNELSSIEKDMVASQSYIQNKAMTMDNTLVC